MNKRYIVIEKSKGKREREVPKVENLSEECKTIFIKNLPYEITEDEIGDRF
jgi:nucleolin